MSDGTLELLDSYTLLRDSHSWNGGRASLMSVFTIISKANKDEDVISGAGRDFIYLNMYPEDLLNFTDEEIIKLVEGGVFWDDESECFCMYV